MNADACAPATGCTHTLQSGNVCRAAVGNCDLVEKCNGVTQECPANLFKPATTTCRYTAGGCDLAEMCTGASGTCPPNLLKAPTVTCRAAAGPCDTAELCTGALPNCPANTFKAAATTCRAAAGICDLAELCGGAAADCPGDAKSSAVCRPVANVCDVAETCDGVHNACPTNALRNVDDDDVCTADACNVVTGPTHAPVSVDDGDSCTADACDPVYGPRHTSDSVIATDTCVEDYAGIYVAAYRDSSVVDYEGVVGTVPGSDPPVPLPNYTLAFEALSQANTPVDGLLASLPWSSFYKNNPPQYTWGHLDTMLQAAAAAGKKASIAVYAGVTTPDWLCAQVAAATCQTASGVLDPTLPGCHVVQVIQSAHQDGHSVCNANRTIVPWDDTFLDTWTQFVADLATHLHTKYVTGTTRELYDVVAIVALTGLNMSTEELRMPATFESDYKVLPTIVNGVQVWDAQSCGRSRFTGCGTMPEHVVDWHDTDQDGKYELLNSEAYYRAGALDGGSFFDQLSFAWDAITATFRDAFPHKLLKAAIIPGSSGFPADHCDAADLYCVLDPRPFFTDVVIAHGLGVANGYTDRFSVLWAALTDADDAASIPQQWKDAKTSGAIMGLQSAQGRYSIGDGQSYSRSRCEGASSGDCTVADPFQKPRYAKLLGNGVGAGATYLELFLPDLIDENMFGFLQCASDQMRRWSHAPTAPVPGLVQATGSTTATMMWTADGFGDGPWTSYEAALASSAGAAFSAIENASGAENFETTATFAGLAPGTEYTGRVRSEVVLENAFGAPLKCPSPWVVVGSDWTQP